METKTYEELLSMSPLELLDYLKNEFMIDTPIEIVSVEDMDKCSRLLLRLSGAYSYLITLSSYAKIKTREMKRGGDKALYEDMVDRKEVIQNMTDMVKQAYTGISRAVTIHIENNHELKTLGIQ